MAHRPRGILLLAVLLSACAKPAAPPPAAVVTAPSPRTVEFRSVLEDSVRLHRVAGWVLQAGAPLCGERVRAGTGFGFATVHDFSPLWRDLARTVAGLGDRPRLLFVTPGSAAAEAGLAPGDEIDAIAGRRVPSGAGATEATARLLGTRLLESVTSGPFTLAVLRERPTKVTLRPVRLCDYRIVLGAEEGAGAVADGDRIVVSRAMLRLARTDHELAWVLAHALAHNVLHRIGGKRFAAAADGLVGEMARAFAAAAGAYSVSPTAQAGARLVRPIYSREFEAQADRAALYVLALGGFPVDRAPALARRLALALPPSAEFLRTHPAWPERFVAMAGAADEIEARRTAGLPLDPGFETAAAARAGRERQRALARQQETAVLAGAGRFMNHFGAGAVRVAIKGPHDVAILVSDGFPERPERLAGALCASIKETGPLPAGPLRITVGGAGGDERPEGYPCD